jgi:hypothetical protein
MKIIFSLGLVVLFITVTFGIRFQSVKSAFVFISENVRVIRVKKQEMRKEPGSLERIRIAR